MVSEYTPEQIDVLPFVVRRYQGEWAVWDCERRAYLRGYDLPGPGRVKRLGKEAAVEKAREMNERSTWSKRP